MYAVQPMKCHPCRLCVRGQGGYGGVLGMAFVGSVCSSSSSGGMNVVSSASRLLTPDALQNERAFVEKLIQFYILHTRCPAVTSQTHTHGHMRTHRAAERANRFSQNSHLFSTMTRHL